MTAITETVVVPARGARRASLRSLVVPASLIALVALAAVFAPILAPYDPLSQSPIIRLQAPSAAHLMGTDELGRDVLSRVIYGARTSLVVGLTSVALSATIGTLIGMVAGFVGGGWDEGIMRFMDVIMAFPAVILAIAIVAAAGSSLANVTFTIAVVQLPVFSRLARANVLANRSNDYVGAAEVIGLSPANVLLRHLLPNSLAPSVTMAGLMIADAILIEAALSFLGLGVVPPTPTWGNILASGREYILRGSWWLTLYPGIAIFITVFSFNLLADGLRDVLDPTSRHRD